MRAWILALGLGVTACGGSQEKVDDKLVTLRHDAQNVDGQLRLSSQATPKHYELDVTIDPTKDTFSGVVRIDIDIAAPLQILTLHGQEFTIENVVLVTGVNKEVGGEAVLGQNGGMAIILNEQVAAGPATLVIRYSAPFKEGLNGLYRTKDGDNWYAFTQFEPLEARRAFPGFDEPRFKTTYRTTMRVPKGMIAATNTRLSDVTEEGGMSVHRFAVSKPMPTYLVAFAVGDFDVVPAEADAIEGVELRLLTTKGKGELGQYMLKRTPAVAQYLADYFAMPFPYDKLDIVAVPNFGAGAMENIGLVTFRDSLLLLDSETASLGQRRAALSVMIHELAHMWFGNLVTMPWWDDLWLNESFATWMASKGLVDMAPQLESGIDSVSGKGGIMTQDSRVEARSIRNPIENSGDVYNAFDGITYGKGANVLKMFEAWVGPEALREGIRAYVKNHAHGSATTEDLLSALDAASGKPVGTAMKTFLDQPGTPSLHVQLVCEDKQKPVLSVSQKRWKPAGSAAAEAQPWQVPACFRYQDGSKSAVHCELVTAPTQAIELPATKCPKWVYPNANESGYYRWTMSPEAVQDLATKNRAQLSLEERVGLQNNIGAMFTAEQLLPNVYLQSMAEFAKEPNRTLFMNSVYAMEGAGRFVPEALKPKWQKKMAGLTGPRLKKVGYQVKAKEPNENGLMRASLIGSHWELSADAKTRDDAAKITATFLKDMKTVPGDIASAVLSVTAKQGSADLWLSYKMALEQAPNPAARNAVIRGLGSFMDADLQRKSLALFLDGSVRAQDMWSLIGPSFDDDATFAVTWDWFTKNYPKIVEILGEKSAIRLPNVGSGFCSEEGKKQVQDFFASVPQMDGQQRNLANTIEGIEQCTRRKTYIHSAFETFLK
jgi:alanyl aminopeptidase